MAQQPPQPPHLSVLTQPGPSTLPRRAMGPRRRAGLFVANPDDLDEEGAQPSRLPSSTSTSQRSPVRGSPVTASSSSSGRSVPIPPVQHPQHGSPSATPQPSLAPIPSVPAPQSSPLPFLTAFPSPQAHPPTPPSNAPFPDHSAVFSPIPPQPPPQPERHMRRAMTAPGPDQSARPPEPRTTTGVSFSGPIPQSPTRALPPLPSPPTSKPRNASPSSANPQTAASHPRPPLPPQSHPPPPTPGAVPVQQEASNRSHIPPHVNRTTSPEDLTSPAGKSDGGQSFGSLGSADMSGRARSGSVPTRNVRLQVTTDNEQFTLVDITGVVTPAGIKDRLRFGDDDYPTLSLYRTEIGEAADTEPLTDEALMQLCNTVGDAKATLKFLVMVTSMPESASATVVPPSELPAAFLTNAARRAGIPPISTNLNAPARTPSRHSKDGSMSSASELERPTSEWSEIGTEEAAEWQAQGQGQGPVPGHGQLRRSSRRSTKRSAGHQLASSNGSARSLLTDPSLSLGGSSPVLPTPPGPSAPQIALRDSSSTSSPLNQISAELDRPSSPWTDDLGRQKGNLTPTPNTANATSDPLPPLAPASASANANTDANANANLNANASANLNANVNANTTPNTTAGPSGASGSDSGLGLNIDYDGIDDASRALIEQLQREDEEVQRREEARRQQLAADEELARRHQQEERAVWRRMQSIQLESRRRQQEQIELDESRARELDAEERRLEDERQRQEAHDAARAAYEAERSERNDTHDDYARGARFADERRQRAQHFEQLQNRNSPFDSRTLPTIEDRSTSTFSGRRPSDAQFESVRQYPATNPLFDQPIYQSPPPNFSSEVPSYNRRPTGFPGSQQDEVSHARDRLHDTRLRGMEGRNTPTHPGQRAITQPIRRGESRLGYTEQDFRAPPLQNVRSMGNMRAISPAPVSRPPFHGVPGRTAITPAPEQRSMPVNGYRSSSVERTQEGRYREPAQSAPSRVPPLEIPASPISPLTIIPFPSPNPRTSDTWAGYPSASSPSLAAPPRRPSWNRQPSLERPQTMHYDHSSVHPTSPRTAALPTRPSTLYSNATPPDTARTVGGYANISPPSYYHSRSRSGSATAPFRPASPFSNQPRRASDAGIEDRGDSQLPYVTSPEHSWLSVPRSGRRDTDAASIAGTVSSGFSDATLRPRATSAEYDENGSEDTVRGGELTRQLQLRAYVHQDDEATVGTLRPNLPLPQANYGDDDGDEVDIFLPGPNIPSESPQPMTRAGLRPSPSRPNLSVKTTGFFRNDQTSTASDSESETTRVQRAKSFARPKDEPDQWHVRPEPELLYEHLDNFFPKIDLDKPIVDGQLSTPSTPAAESPARVEIQPPPVHPSRQTTQNPLSPRQSPSAEISRPPQHPASRAAAFNKAENRKSIRVMADHKAKSLARESKNFMGIRDVFSLRQETKKPERRKSSSMWGHKVVEVTPSKLQQGQVPTSIPESPAADGKPPTLNWVKGELIGKGSYGRVYIALNVTTGDMMAVKQVELPSNEVDRNDHRQRVSIEALYVEIELLKDLYHPNIVAYLGCETSPQYISIFLEYVPGGTIASIYRTPNQGRFEEQLVKFFTAQILEGLAYLHDRNIWHRDLKGDNILVDAAGVCKISDFGISKQTEDAYNSFGTATNMKGSVFWMAPEVLRSATERSYSGKIDIWSLGCVVMEMWTGTRPWGIMEQVETMMELYNYRRRPPLPPEIQLNDVALDFMNEKCLATDPRDRPTAKELMEHRFITERDPAWCFAASKIGKAVAKKAPRTMKAV